MNKFLTNSENEELIKRIKEGDILLEKIINAYNDTAIKYNKTSSERESMKVVIRQLLRWAEEDGFKIPYEKWDDVIESTNNDDNFFLSLLEWFVDHMNDFGENYGL